jgi:deazaflavin-dependent oxidoreductase (nitroreductase family)
VTEFDRRTVEEFRANGGRAGGVLAGTPLILIHHVGAKSGTEHVTPLAHSAQGDGLIAIVASNGGSPRHPACYHNLKANPAITVELGIRRSTATAEEQAGPARAELWAKLIQESPDLGEFAASMERSILCFSCVARDTLRMVGCYAWTAGCRWLQGAACSSWLATRTRRSSRPYAATSCTPTGRPPGVQCRGRLTAGWPVMLNCAV